MTRTTPLCHLTLGAGTPRPCLGSACSGWNDDEEDPTTGRCGVVYWPMRARADPAQVAPAAPAAPGMGKEAGPVTLREIQRALAEHGLALTPGETDPLSDPARDGTP